MDAPMMEGLLEVATRAAQGPGARICSHFTNQRLAVERKGDGSPVTAADREAETMIRTMLEKNPLSAEFDILGEEFGQAGDTTRYRWLIDPIDGTRSFVNGIPLFGTILALEDRESDKALIGVIHLPVLKVTYSAARGLGCVRNGKPVSVSKGSTIADSIIATGDIAQFISAGCEYMFHQLTSVCPYVRAYTDCFGHGLVISGAVGAMIDPALNPWDARATQVMVEEAGGKMVFRTSNEPKKIDAIFGTAALVEQLVKQLNF